MEEITYVPPFISTGTKIVDQNGLVLVDLRTDERAKAYVIDINKSQDSTRVFIGSDSEEEHAKKAQAFIEAWNCVAKKPSLKAQFFEFHQDFTNQMLEISKKKNSDYTGASDDPFSNFSSVEGLGISTEQGFIVRMNDKMKRLASFVEQGTLEVKDESATDTLQDLANYCILFAGYLKFKKK